MGYVNNRALGAITIAFAGAVLGFATGRLSTLLVPPSGLSAATQQGSVSKPSIPLEPAETPKQAGAASDGAGTLKAEAKPSSNADTDASTQADAGPQQGSTSPASVMSRALSPAEPEADRAATSPETTLLNPDPRNQGGPAQSRLSEGPGAVRTLASNPEALERCRAKYQSFDPSDGTYKPYDQNARVPCPYLR